MAHVFATLAEAVVSLLGGGMLVDDRSPPGITCARALLGRRGFVKFFWSTPKSWKPMRRRMTLGGLIFKFKSGGNLEITAPRRSRREAVAPLHSFVLSPS